MSNESDGRARIAKAYELRVKECVDAMAGVDDPALLMRIVRSLVDNHQRHGGASATTLNELVNASSQVGKFQ